MKKLIAAALSLAIALTIPLAACDKGGKTTSVKVNGSAFTPSDYAAPLPKSSAESKAPTRADFHEGTFAALGASPYLRDFTYEGGHRLYSVLTHDFVSKTSKHYLSFTYSADNIKANVDMDGTADYYGPTGALIAETPDAIDWEKQTISLGDTETTYYKYTIKDGLTTYKYFSLAVSKDEAVWNTIAQSAYPTDGQQHDVGEIFEPEKTPVVDPDEYPDNAMRDYSYTVEGSRAKTYTFYRGDKFCSSVILPASAGEGTIVFVNDYMFYLDVDMVSAEATSGYDIELNTDYGAYKSTLTLCRFNFVKGGKVKTFDLDFACTQLTPLYNQTEGKFDKLLVNAVKKTDGVAVLSDFSEFDYILVLDENAKVSADLTAADFTFDTPLYKLSADRYLAGSNIMDGDFTRIAKLPSEYYSVCPDSQMIVCSSNSSVYAIDYNGVLLFEPFAADGKYFISDGNIVSCPTDCDVYESTLYNRKNPTGTEYEGLVPKGTLAYSSIVSYGFLGIGYRYDRDAEETFRICDFSGNIVSDVEGFKWTEQSYYTFPHLRDTTFIEGVKDLETCTVVVY